jgi:hypothetical protein
LGTFVVLVGTYCCCRCRSYLVASIIQQAAISRRFNQKSPHAVVTFEILIILGRIYHELK